MKSVILNWPSREIVGLAGLADKSLARTENSLQVLEKFTIFGNVQPQLQPHLRQRRQFYAGDWMSAAFSGL
jgi:hypothetical protein